MAVYTVSSLGNVLAKGMNFAITPITLPKEDLIPSIEQTLKV